MSKLAHDSVTTKILHPDDEAHVLEALSILRGGGIVALPTETVYGLAANAWLAEAVAKVFIAKNRPANNPLIWHVHDAEAAKRLFDWPEFSPRAKQRFALLAQHFWPGPLTIVAAQSALVPSKGLHTVAVRIPRSEVTLKILRLANFPLVMPSANLSSRPSPTCGEHVLKTLIGRIDAIMDAGSCDLGLESTVVRFDQERPTILRPGLISASQLEQVLDEPVTMSQNLEEAQRHSPGLAYKHYAPQVDQVLLESLSSAGTRWRTTNTLVGRRSDLEELALAFGQRPAAALTISLPDEPQSFAQGLYGALYRAEDRPHEVLVLVAPPEESDVWTAILDRLGRSAGATI